MKPCHARSCGLFPIIDKHVSCWIEEWQRTRRTFVGVDVSSTCTGVAAVQLIKGRVECVHSVALDMKKKASDSKDTILHRRFDILKHAFMDLRKSFEDVKGNWEISVEDKILRAGTAKGIVGSHTLAEVIVAARIAAYQVFPEHLPSKINPRSARAGLGLNIMGEGASREETKSNVLAFVKETVPDFEFTGKSSDEDRADAFVIALSAVRSALNRELVNEPDVRKHFQQCHNLLPDPKKGNVHKRKLEDEVTTELDDRIQGWIDEIWLYRQFPKRVAI